MSAQSRSSKLSLRAHAILSLVTPVIFLGAQIALFLLLMVEFREPTPFLLLLGAAALTLIFLAYERMVERYELPTQVWSKVKGYLRSEVENMGSPARSSSKTRSIATFAFAVVLICVVFVLLRKSTSWFAIYPLAVAIRAAWPDLTIFIKRDSAAEASASNRVDVF